MTYGEAIANFGGHDKHKWGCECPYSKEDLLVNLPEGVYAVDYRRATKEDWWLFSGMSHYEGNPINTNGYIPANLPVIIVSKEPPYEDLGIES